jgi:hypothetical protein
MLKHAGDTTATPSQNSRLFGAFGMFGRHKRFSDRDLGGDIAIDRLLWVELSMMAALSGRF